MRLVDGSPPISNRRRREGGTHMARYKPRYPVAASSSLGLVDPSPRCWRINHFAGEPGRRRRTCDESACSRTADRVAYPSTGRVNVQSPSLKSAPPPAWETFCACCTAARTTRRTVSTCSSTSRVSLHHVYLLASDHGRV